MNINNESEKTTVINNFINLNETELRERIASQILENHLICLVSIPCTHEEDADIAMGRRVF